MNFKQAYAALLSGKRVRLPGWGGFWAYKQDDGVYMFTRRGEMIPLFKAPSQALTLESMASEEWEVVPVGEVTEHDEARTAAHTGPLTSEYIESLIKEKEVFRVRNTGMHLCKLYLSNGEQVSGMGETAEDAEAHAVDNVWMVEGYRLRMKDKDRLAVRVETIARVCHEVNRAYCAATGDYSQLAWEHSPMWQRTSAVNGVEFHLSNPNAGASASHENWMKEKLEQGWCYGDKKDTDKKTHPCIVPFDQLPLEQQIKDHLFRAVVHALK